MSFLNNKPLILSGQISIKIEKYVSRKSIKSALISSCNFLNNFQITEWRISLFWCHNKNFEMTTSVFHKRLKKSVQNKRTDDFGKNHTIDEKYFPLSLLSRCRKFRIIVIVRCTQYSLLCDIVTINLKTRIVLRISIYRTLEKKMYIGLSEQYIFADTIWDPFP